MLTADLVDVRKRNGELFTRRLDPAGRAEAVRLAEACLEVARTSVGTRREEVEAGWTAVCAEASRTRLAGALRKLVEDGCVFEGDGADVAVDLRRELFGRASEARKTNQDGLIDRDHLISEFARDKGLSAEALERALFADLRGEHVLKAPPTPSAESIVEAYELGQAQAILLRAVKITCEVRDFSPGVLRAFFAKLKFHKLLFTAERTAEGAFRVVVDGPYSMFDAGTRYGLRLALLLPALRALDTWSLEADVRWGQAREPLVFRLSSDEGRTPSRGNRKGPRGAASSREVRANVEAPVLADDVQGLLDDLRRAPSAFVARPATELFEVPGLGLCIPDLTLTPSSGGEPVHVEVLGFWSRDAVFRRISLVEQGLSARIVFAVSARLRVSEELLDDAAPSSLYVYKGKMSARALLGHVERVATRRSATRKPRSAPRS